MLKVTVARCLGLVGRAVLAAVAGTALPASAAAAVCPAADTVPGEQELAQASTAVVCEINRERRGRDLPGVRAEPRLALAGERHARDMVGGGFFSHVSPGGRGMVARVQAAGYLDGAGRWALGEVLAWGWGWRATPAATVAAWMDSPPHRRVLLTRRYREVGIGVALGLPIGPAPGPGATYAAELGVVSR